MANNGTVELESETGEEPIAKPKSFGEAFRSMKDQAKGETGEGVESTAVDPPEQGEEEDVAEEDVSEKNADALMAEFEERGMLPPDFAVPNGKTAGFVKFEADMTETPGLGDRYLVLWTLSVADEKRAIIRTGGQPAGMIPEMAKGMIRCVDGKWSSVSGRVPRAGEKLEKVDTLWEQIGPGCRQIIETLYINQHNLSMEQKARFFTRCVAFRSAAGSPKAATSGTGTAQGTRTTAR